MSVFGCARFGCDRTDHTTRQEVSTKLDKATTSNMATSNDAPDNSLEGHLSNLLELVGCLQSLEDEMLDNEIGDAGFESNEEIMGSRCVNAELATSIQPVGGTGMFFF